MRVVIDGWPDPLSLKYRGLQFRGWSPSDLQVALMRIFRGATVELGDAGNDPLSELSVAVYGGPATNADRDRTAYVVEEEAQQQLYGGPRNRRWAVRVRFYDVS